MSQISNDDFTTGMKVILKVSKFTMEFPVTDDS